MKLSEITKNNLIPILYHGTCQENANFLIKNGWEPNLFSYGSNMGQNRYLYLTSMKEDALWFAEQRGCSNIVEIIDIPIEYLKVDPEDGFADTVEEELNNQFGLP